MKLEEEEAAVDDDIIADIRAGKDVNTQGLMQQCAPQCNILEHSATPLKMLQHTGICCNTLQDI